MYVEADKIPKVEGMVMGSLLIGTITDYFRDPKHQKEFEEWKRQQASKPKILRMAKK